MKLRRFSAVKNMNTRITGIGFKDGFNYDQDLNRLQKGKTLRELNSPNVYNREMAKLNKELEELKKGR